MKAIITKLVLKYFRLFAILQLKKFAPDILAITGSAGKTSCRNAVEAVLKDKYTLKVGYHANSETGIPLNILGIIPQDYSMFDWLRMMLLAPIKLLTNWQPYHKYVVELGIDAPYPPKNMSYLLTILKPRTAIFLNALPVHTQNFDSLVNETDSQKRSQALRRLIAQEKGKLITSLPANGLAILNADDPLVASFNRKTQAQVMLFGRRTGDVRILKLHPTTSGTTITFKYMFDTENLTFDNYALPAHYAHTLAAAVCVGIDEDYTLTETLQLIKKHFRLPPGRASLIQGMNQSLILDSSYNASTQPVIDMLELLSTIKAKRKLALLGDMRELGVNAKSEHQKIARHAPKHADQIFLVGPLMQRYALELLVSKMGPGQVSWFPNADQAAANLKKTLKAGDCLLVKGSQNTIYLEAAVKQLMQNPSKATKLLCRQSQFWQRQRQRAGLQS
jgi:UDP-N-acetylmuramoyl-tripeptide--D-alanyl-D-alanine ligase